MGKSYAEKLKDPRWQKKRLFILSRDDFTCQECGNGEDTLHVHHLHYNRGKDPWEYRDDSLTTLCSDCHKVETDNGKIKQLDDKEKVKRQAISAGMDPFDFVYRLLELKEQECFLLRDRLHFDHEISTKIHNPSTSVHKV